MTIEDCLEILLGFDSNYSHNFSPKKEDVGILMSVSKQIGKGTALTDRQLDMLKLKLLEYKDIFKNLDVDVDEACSNLRYPLRQIDRTKYVKIDNNSIKIRFPFSKKIIMLIEDIVRCIGREHHFHQKGSHIHEFTLSEQSIHQVVKRFKNKDFEIDQALLELYDRVSIMLEHASDYVPGIYNYEIKNCHPNAKKYMLDTIGLPSKDNIHLYKDRANMLGLIYFDSQLVTNAINNCTPLTQKIINRKKASVFINQKSYSISSIIESLFELDRFPIAVVVDEFRNNDLDCIDNFYTIHKALTNLIDNSQMSVLFRLDNNSSDNTEFNNYVKNNNLNNLVDENTKVVYIKDKAPKFLIKNNWQPSVCLSCCSNVRMMSRKHNFIGSVDLTVHWEKELSTMAEYYNRDSFAEGIEKL